MWQAEADTADTVCFACHGSGPNSVNHGEILFEYGNMAVFHGMLNEKNVFTSLTIKMAKLWFEEQFS